MVEITKAIYKQVGKANFKSLKERIRRIDMLFGYLIDYFCKILLIGLAVGVIGFFAACVILMVGEKMKWW